MFNRFDVSGDDISIGTSPPLIIYLLLQILYLMMSFRFTRIILNGCINKELHMYVIVKVHVKENWSNLWSFYLFWFYIMTFYLPFSLDLEEWTSKSLFVLVCWIFHAKGHHWLMIYHVFMFKIAHFALILWKVETDVCAMLCSWQNKNFVEHYDLV